MPDFRRGDILEIVAPRHAYEREHRGERFEFLRRSEAGYLLARPVGSSYEMPLDPEAVALVRRAKRAGTAI